MSDKININKLADLAKFRVAVGRLNIKLEDLKLEVVALLHDNESLKRENTYLRKLLDDI